MKKILIASAMACSFSVHVYASGTQSARGRATAPKTAQSSDINTTLRRQFELFSSVLIERVTDLLTNLTAHFDDLRKDSNKHSASIHAKLDKILAHCDDATREDYAIFDKLSGKQYAELMDFCNSAKMYDIVLELAQHYITSRKNDLYVGMMHYFRGMALYLQKKYDLAKGEFLSAYEKNKKGSRAHESLYYIYKILRDHDKDEASAEQVLESLLRIEKINYTYMMYQELLRDPLAQKIREKLKKTASSDAQPSTNGANGGEPVRTTAQ